MVNKEIFVSAGEVSGDIHGADLVQELKKNHPDIRFTGLGGKKMQAAGLKLLGHDVSHWSTIGFLDSLRFYSEKKRLYQGALRYLQQKRPAGIVLIDNQGFNIPLAAAAKKIGIKTIYYFPPHVSIWGEWEAPRLCLSADLILVPMRADYEVYEKYRNKLLSKKPAEVVFTGNPLLDKIAAFQPDPDFLTKQGLDKSKKTVGLFPGSRYQEVETLLEPMLEAARHLIEERGLQVLVSLSHDAFEERVKEALEKTGLKDQIVLVKNNAYGVMHASDALILASGTATLEAALFQKPPIICYKISTTSYYIIKMLVKKKIIGLPNILLGRKVFPELLQKECRAELMVNQVYRFLDMDKPGQISLAQDFDKIRESLGAPPVVAKVAERIRKELALG